MVSSLTITLSLCTHVCMHCDLAFFYKQWQRFKVSKKTVRKLLPNIAWNLNIVYCMFWYTKFRKFAIQKCTLHKTTIKHTCFWNILFFVIFFYCFKVVYLSLLRIFSTLFGGLLLCLFHSELQGHKFRWVCYHGSMIWKHKQKKNRNSHKQTKTKTQIK